MTIKQLKEVIKDKPENMKVFLDERLTDDEFKYGLANSAFVKKILFYDSSEPEDEDHHAYEEVLILSEE